MIDTNAFKTKTEFWPRHFPSRNSAWVVGLDVGYSGVKVICPNGAFCFPSYAKRMRDGQALLKKDEPDDIYYRDEHGTWCVGGTAYAQIGPADTTESDSELFGRSRYYSPIFLVVARTGLALALRKNIYGAPESRRIIVQTGLPPKYEKADAPFLVDILSGHHVFEVKVGRHDWEAFDITLAEDDIHVMPQPKGALISASVDGNGGQAKGAKDFFTSNVIVPDTGFGTFDVFTITHGVVTDQDTFPNLGMGEVFSRTCRDIMNAYGTEITVAGLQNYLAKGMVPVFSLKDRSRTNKSFAEILYKNCADVCHESVEMLLNTHYYCRDTDYIIPAGGAYDIWHDLFDEEFSKMEGLKIIPGNANDKTLANVYSNVRGYYFNLAMRN